MLNNIICIFLIILIFNILHNVKNSNIRNNELLKETFITNANNYIKCNKYKIGKILKEIFNENNIHKDLNNWNIYLPCTYTGIENEIKNMEYNLDNKYIFGISGCDKIVSKAGLWLCLLNTYGRIGALQITPKTYRIRNSNDIQLFKQEYRKGNVYILKNIKQAQKGLKISNNYNDILNDIKNKKYIIIQELLKDPFTINGRKINLRIYFLIVCKNNTLSSYIHNNGFIYYTKGKYNINSIDKKNHITTGYIDREVYEKNPLTILDLYNWLNTNGYSPELLQYNIIILFKQIINAIKIHLCKSNKTKKSVSFQLFGCDIAPDSKLNVKLIEINKGPDFNAKDQRDKKVKKKVLIDIFSILNIIKNKSNNNFIKIS